MEPLRATEVTATKAPSPPSRTATTAVGPSIGVGEGRLGALVAVTSVARSSRSTRPHALGLAHPLRGYPVRGTTPRHVRPPSRVAPAGWQPERPLSQDHGPHPFQGTRRTRRAHEEHKEEPRRGT